MAKNASSVWKSFSYLFDESQGIAKTYRASCTPDFYLFDKDLKLYYRYVYKNEKHLFIYIVCSLAIRHHHCTLKLLTITFDVYTRNGL